MQLELSVLDWSACASGLTTSDEWLAWAGRAPVFPDPVLKEPPSLSAVPAMLRRRLNRIGRMACHVAYACDNGQTVNPIVFASRYGDTDKSLSLLADLVSGFPLSPSGFGLSVHNAIAAQYGIARGHTGNAVVVAGAQATVAAAMAEASALLQDGASEVLIVYYDTPLPNAYSSFHDEATCEYAWAWRVSQADHQDALASVRICYEDAGHINREHITWWPSGLMVFRHFLTHLTNDRATTEELVCEERFGACTRWSIHA